MISKNFFQSEKSQKNLLVQFSRARQDESNAIENFQKFENFFVYNEIFPKNFQDLPDLF